MGAPFRLSSQVVTLKGDHGWSLINWLNLENFSINDTRHPLFEYLESDAEHIEQFTVNGSRETWDYLVENYFVVRHQDEIKPFLTKELAQISENSRTLQLILLPVNQACNFDCVYCYEDHDLRHSMKQRDRDIILDFIKASAPEVLQIEFFGGEPLLGKKFIVDLCAAIKAEEAFADMQFTASMTTNGYLLDIDTFRLLSGLGFEHFQITLDGLPEDHNSLRPLKGGDASFDAIFQNLRAISDLTDEPVSIVVRVNYNQESLHLDKLKQFNLQICSGFTNDPRFQFIFKPIGEYGSDNAEKANALCQDTHSEELESHLLGELEKTGSDLGTLISYMKRSHFCYAGKQNNYLLFPACESEDGRTMKVGKCTVALDDTTNFVGHLHPGGKLEINSNFSKWVANSESFEIKCMDCFLVTQCYASACPAANIEFNKKVCPRVHQTKEDLSKRIVSLCQKEAIFQ
ncbi:MAG: radical SAM protein [Rhodospirillales bacterium]|nr:radical SAM protein [Rhodospirillales bacterium]MBL6940653.1 radical SAM protein [Rhodospirillales bacterium]